MAMLFGIDLRVIYVGDEGLVKQDFAFPLANVRHRMQVYLDEDGYFDVVYRKAHIKSAGVCQSILLEVPPYCPKL